ncbi:MAG: SCP2 sterol-binding domain-containing protein, partial [Actinomycetota bacterium]|nr:SCP2 sterol-binding domain-containing protein [Actinomycetota bacterium]
LDGNAVAEPGAIQWDFTDAEPRHVLVANGSTRAERGRVERPRLTLKASLEDFVDVAANRQDPKRLLARGRLRARGDLRWLWKSRRMFPV